MDTLILLVVFTLSGLVARDAGRLGHAGWCLWQQLGAPLEELDAHLIRGLAALHRMDDHAEQVRAQGDTEFAALIEQTLALSRATLMTDLEDGLVHWRSFIPLLTLAWSTTPLSQRGLRSRRLRALVRADALLARLPHTGCALLLSLDGHMIVVRRALRRVRQDMTRTPTDGPEPPGVLAHDQAALVRAGLECHEMLVKSLSARREQLFGTRH